MKNKDRRAVSFLSLAISITIVITLSFAFCKNLEERNFFDQDLETLYQEGILSDNDWVKDLGLALVCPQPQPISCPAKNLLIFRLKRLLQVQKSFVLRC